MSQRETRSTCPYCGVGCGVIIASEGNTIVGVRGDPEHPANRGRLCFKGSTLHLTATAAVTAQIRLLQPMHRLTRAAPAQPLSWGVALDQVAVGLSRIIHEHGAQAVGVYASGQLLTEDYYVFNKLVKGLIGSNNIDTNSRLCMSSAVAGYRLTLGADAPPTCYDDIARTECLFIVGSNTAWAHPVLFRRIEDAKARNPQLKIVVVDPRRTDTAEIADLYLPLQPGTDVMLFHGMLHIMLWEGWTDPAYIAAHTQGFEALKTLVRDCTPDVVTQVCGLNQQDLYLAARWFAGVHAQDSSQRKSTLSLYCQGLNQSHCGTDKNATLINLHLATGQIGRPGAGPFSLTGQPNAMGGREVGGMANMLSAHRDLSNPQHRAEVAALWGVPSVPSSPGLSAVEMFQAAADGQVKALWIACTNPAQSMPDQATVRRALQRAELVIVQEAFANTATCGYADILLPATTWGEKEGSVTNSERCISRVRAAVAPPGQARHDWQIVVEVAQRLQAQLRPGLPSLFAYDTPESIWNEHRASTQGRDLDITGLSYSLLDAQGPLQWPVPAGSSRGRARLYENGEFAHPGGQARFAAVPYQAVAEPPDARYPFSLITGRLRDQWHGMSRTGTLGRLFGHVPEPCVQVHPQDMARRGWREGELLHVTSRRGSIVVPVQANAELGLGQTFMAMHWGGEYLSGCSSTGDTLAGVNALTTSAHCPVSRQPELKHCAVKLLKAELPWSLVGLAWLPGDQALSRREALRQFMAAFGFASCVPFSSGAAPSPNGASERVGVLFRAAAYEVPPLALIEQIEALLGLDAPDVLRYADRRRGQRRSVRLVRDATDTRLEAFLLAGDTRAEAWIKTLLQDELPAQSYGRLLLVPEARAPLAVVSRGKTVCSCFNVSDAQIAAQLAHCQGSAPARLQALQQTLQCGTQCGSCVPELQRMVRTA